MARKTTTNKKAPTAGPGPQSNVNASPVDTPELGRGIGNAMQEKGYTGLKHFTGMVNEEFLKEMEGAKGIRLLTEMRDNHPIIGALMYAIDMLIRDVNWNIEAASTRPEDVKAADLVSSCLDDMQFSWQDTISEILSFLTYGFSYHEICYKKRSGPNSDPMLSSRYTDNMIGWAKIPVRSQDSLYRWELDDAGSVVGMHQVIYQTTMNNNPNYSRYIPFEKALLFKTRSFKNNPHGRSVLRNSVTTYLTQRKLESIETIGMERDLAGYPVMYAPARIMGPSATPDEQKIYADLITAVRAIRRDSSEGLVFPSDTYLDPAGTPTAIPKYKLELLSTGGSRQFDTTAVLQRLDQRIAMTVLADFVMIGHGSSGGGSYSMHQNKTDMFVVALGAFLDVIAEEFNRNAIPRLLALNGLQVIETPRLAHGDFDKMDLGEIGAYVQAMSAAGMPLFPDAELENYLRTAGGLPESNLEDGRLVGTGTGDRINDPMEKPTSNASPTNADPATGKVGATPTAPPPGKQPATSGLTKYLRRRKRNI